MLLVSSIRVTGLQVTDSNVLVPKKGLEPPHPCEYMDLNHARLPIPPLRHEVSCSILRCCVRKGLLLYSHKPKWQCQTAQNSCESIRRHADSGSRQATVYVDRLHHDLVRACGQRDQRAQCASGDLN